MKQLIIIALLVVAVSYGITASRDIVNNAAATMQHTVID